LAGKWFWFAELASHFKLQYLLFSFGFFIFFLGRRDSKYIALNVVVMLISAYDIFPLLDRKELQFHSTQKQTLTIVQFNRNINNNQDNDVIQWLSKRANEFDIVLIQEITPTFIHDLKKLTPIYEYRFIKAAIGQAVLSKKEIIDENLKLTSDQLNLFITVKVRLSKTNYLKIFGIHTIPPKSQNWFLIRNEQLKEFGKYISKDPSKLKIAIGDLNITPYSYYFTQFERTVGLKNTMIGFGPQNSWPSIFTLSIFRIPIDHIFISNNIHVLERKIGPNLGSDHFPVILKISL